MFGNSDLDFVSRFIYQVRQRLLFDLTSHLWRNTFTADNTKNVLLQYIWWDIVNRPQVLLLFYSISFHLHCISWILVISRFSFYLSSLMVCSHLFSSYSVLFSFLSFPFLVFCFVLISSYLFCSILSCSLSLFPVLFSFLFFSSVLFSSPLLSSYYAIIITTSVSLSYLLLPIAKYNWIHGEVSFCLFFSDVETFWVSGRQA